VIDWIDELVDGPEYRAWAPNRPWEAAQEEHDVVFVHYEVDEASLERLLPAELELQIVGGSAWVGIIALRMRRVHWHSRRLPLTIRRFPEVDLVTYVTCQGKRGLFFLGIESARRLLAPLTRWTSGLPYLYSGLRVVPVDGAIRVTAGPRPSQGATAAVLDLTYQPGVADAPLGPGSPVELLMDQYSAFVVDWRGRIAELDEVHNPWRPQPVRVEVRANTLGSAVGIELGATPTMAHYAASRRVLTWAPSIVRPGRPGLAPTSPRR
jgi:uncharacterized protein YqjF (DUF2071 family)